MHPMIRRDIKRLRLQLVTLIPHHKKKCNTHPIEGGKMKEL